MASCAEQVTALVPPPFLRTAVPAWSCSLLFPPTEWVLRGSSRPSRPQRCHFVVAIPGPTALSVDLARSPNLVSGWLRSHLSPRTSTCVKLSECLNVKHLVIVPALRAAPIACEYLLPIWCSTLFHSARTLFFQGFPE